MPSRICEYCSTPFVVKYERSPNRFCSRKCFGKYLTKSHDDAAREHFEHLHLIENQIHYLAGFLDAEGSLWGGYGGAGKGVYAIHVLYYQSSMEVLNEIRDTLQFGIVSERKYCDSHFGTKPMHQWECSVTPLSLRLLRLLLPYLRVKRSDAIAILEEDVDEVKPITFSYIAGFLDGEGSVIDYVKKPYLNYSHYVLTITQKTLPILEEIRQFLGFGSIYPKQGGGWQFTIVHHEKQLDLIRGISPFAIVKKQQLESALRFIEGKDWDAFHKKGERLDGEAVKSKYEAGADEREVAKAFGVSLPIIQRKLCEVGARVRTSAETRALKNPNPLDVVGKTELEFKYMIERKSTYTVADEYGTSRGNVCNRFKELGIPLRPNAKLRNVPNAELIAKYHELGTVRTSKVYGVCPESLNRKLKQLGVPLVRAKQVSHRLSKLHNIPREELAVKYAKVLSVEKLGIEYSVSPSVMWECLKRHGIPMSRSGRVAWNRKLVGVSNA